MTFGDRNGLVVSRAKRAIINIAHASGQGSRGHAGKVKGVGGNGGEGVGGAFVGDGFEEGRAAASDSAPSDPDASIGATERPRLPASS